MAGFGADGPRVVFQVGFRYRGCRYPELVDLHAVRTLVDFRVVKPEEIRGTADMVSYFRMFSTFMARLILLGETHG